MRYKTFCWSLGNTSFRTKNFNKTIEEQLALLDEFWLLDENQNEKWAGNKVLQTRYYEFMKKKGFIEGNAANKPKDAREKTSGLVDIGLINEGRQLSEVGKILLQISSESDFSSDNQFQISKDSFIYLKQLLKTTYRFENKNVRPFMVLLYLLSKFDYLTVDESIYLLPLCIGKNETEEIISGILKLRNNQTTIDDIIIHRLSGMQNYTDALTYFLNNSVTEDLICEIGLNRKSRNYDKFYYELYIHLYDVFVNKNISALLSVYRATKKINIGKWWRNYLFNTIFETAITTNPLLHLKKTVFDDTNNENDFKKAFFYTLHLFKAKATLSDYFDLNRRYFKITDIVLFEDDMVKLDVIPKYFFKSIVDKLYTDMFTSTDLLYKNCNMADISSYLVINNDTIVNSINEEADSDIRTVEEARKVFKEVRYKRFNHLVDTKFTNDKLILLLNFFEKRNDAEIRNMVTDNADIPTIFEYILGIIWYKISERKGEILDYMKLSLDADMLPKTHASGGNADIIYEYSETDIYSEHTLLLEATLTESSNQRRMEMEPVSRHLGKYLIQNNNIQSYCVFITNNLDINVISDFRIRKITPFYDSQDYTKFINGMKIIPLQTSELKNIIKNGKTYKELYLIFEDAFNSELPPHKWYEKLAEMI